MAIIASGNTATTKMADWSMAMAQDLHRFIETTFPLPGYQFAVKSWAAFSSRYMTPKTSARMPAKI